MKSIFKALSMTLATTLIAAISAQADDLQCVRQSTVAGCLTHIEQETNTLKADQEPRFLNIARNTDGSIRYMVHSSEFMKDIGRPLPDAEIGAVEYCKDPKYVPQPVHLPSARELAQLARSFGADMANVKLDRYWYQISVKNADGTADSFYFHSARYQPPDEDVGNNQFWSSSVSSDVEDFAIVLDGGNGLIGTNFGAR